MRNVLLVSRCSVAMATLATVVSAGACAVTTGPSLIRLDASSLTAPTTITATESLTADVVVDRGACESFDHFDAIRTGSQILLVPIGRDETPKGGTCTLQLILEHHTYTVAPPYGSAVTISVRRADGSLLSQQVTVQ